MQRSQLFQFVTEDVVRGKTIMIADDDSTTHVKFRKLLASRGFTVLHAYDGQQAYRMATELRPDIILLDISMPLMDGRDVCRKLKSAAETKGICIIMITGRDMPSDRQVGFEVGADEYIEKPCTPFYLERTIRKFLMDDLKN